MKDGGPAFPMPSGEEPRVNRTTHYNEGMSLRSWLAGMAMQAIAADPDAKARGYSCIAAWSYELADEMLKLEAEAK